MNPQCEDIKDILVAEGIVASAATIHLSRMPETPDSVIAILDQSGMPPEDLIQYYKPKVQIIVRGARNSYETTWGTANDIYIGLHGYGAAEVNGTNYVGIWATSDIIPLGYDESDRPLFSLNFLIHRS